MITGNAGEWSEVYALFKLLGDKQLFLGDKDIKKLKGLFYPIIKILRSQSDGTFEYSIRDEIILITGGNETIKIPIVEFKEKALYLLQAIKDNKKERTFSIPVIESFMKSFNCISLKAGSSRKTDITIVVHDQRTRQQPALGFSIKSQLKSPSTLLNAGKTTNFIYKITSCHFSEEDIKRINAIQTKHKVKDRLAQVQARGGQLEFVKAQRTVFSNNLVLIDSLLPQILAHILSSYYSSKLSKLTDLVRQIEEDNFLNFDTSKGHKFYEYKMKRFLTDVALGMMPSKVWTGKYDATGGYLIVREDGDVLCYHIYNRNKFEDYLFNNTKLETASSNRHDFGQIYREGEQFFFKLNLQIRFLK